MKKRIAIILCLILILAVLIVMTGCNKQIFDIEYKFDNAYIKVGEKWIDVEVSKWNDYGGEQIQLILKDGSVLLVSSTNCILYKGHLPS